MTHEPRNQADYGARETEAARRVLIDLGQVLGSYFADAIVVVGGWVPSLLIPNADELHVGSLDVDLALNPDKLRDGRYAEIVKSLLSAALVPSSVRRTSGRALVHGSSGSLKAAEVVAPVSGDHLRTVSPGFRAASGHTTSPGSPHSLRSLTPRSATQVRSLV